MRVSSAAHGWVVAVVVRVLHLSMRIVLINRVAGEGSRPLQQKGTDLSVLLCVRSSSTTSMRSMKRSR